MSMPGCFAGCFALACPSARDLIISSLGCITMSGCGNDIACLLGACPELFTCLTHTCPTTGGGGSGGTPGGGGP
jgi:hypothetical protein